MSKLKCKYCNEPIVFSSPKQFVCSTCYAADDLGRFDEVPKVRKAKAKLKQPKSKPRD